MQEVVIATYCDRCYQTDQAKTDASLTVEVTVGADQARLDLCERCDQALLAQLRELIRTRAAAQRALDRSAGASPDAHDAGERSRQRSGVMVHCGQCQVRIALRSRGSHARHTHGCKPQDITWAFGDDVTEVWTCTCGLAFPSEHGRNTHAHRAGHALPDLAGQQS